MTGPLIRHLDESDMAFRERVKAESRGFRKAASREVEWDWQHAHRGSPYYNCGTCGMPFGANQHKRLRDGQWWPITFEEELDHEQEIADA